MKWYTLESQKILEKLDTNKDGLSNGSIKERLAKYGYNKLPVTKPDSYFKILVDQFKSPVIYILMIAAVIVLVMGDTADALMILAVLIINAGIGAFQEGKAQDSLNALRDFIKTEATVVRDGDEKIISDEEIVPGDVIFLQEGNKVPADSRLIEVSSLRVDESALTGESVPVFKITEAIEGDDIPPADQRNMIFRGSYVVGGNAYAVVVETGIDTVIGEISQELKGIDTEMPLKENIRRLSRVIIIGIVLVCSVLFVLGIMNNVGAREMFATVVAISVSAIPSGLPMVVTIILSAGVYRMSKRNALVRKLQAVEALGQASVIAVDKTGTITLNQMMVSSFFTDGNLFEVSGSGYDPKGEIFLDGKLVDVKNNRALVLAGKVSALNASANIAYSESEKIWKRLSGDPTEAALIVFAQKLGFHRDILLDENPIILEEPFDSATRYHAVLSQVEGKPFLAIAGAPENIIPICDNEFRNSSKNKFTEKEKEEMLAKVTELSKKGLRVIALAFTDETKKEIDLGKLPSGLTFLGLTAINDTLRPEVSQAVLEAHKAGIRTAMITGDHAETARSIAESAGIWREGDTVITGEKIRSMTIPELKDVLPTTTVFARITPGDKLKIIEAYRANGEIVAMTGDGVNDALSLAAADLGVAMGKTGTEVAKEAADIILIDDNFSSIVAAVEEGRSIYATIKKVVLYLFSTSIGEILAISAALILDLPLPLVASQIIWLNFVTDGFLVIALAMEPKQSLRGSTSLNSKNLIDKPMVERMFVQGGVMMVGTIFLFTSFLDDGYAYASTMALTVLAVFQWFNVWNCRTDKLIHKKQKITKALFWTFVIVIFLQILAIYTTPLQSLLRTVPLSIMDWVLIIVVSSSIIVADLLWKEFDHKRNGGLPPRYKPFSVKTREIPI